MSELLSRRIPQRALHAPSPTRRVEPAPRRSSSSAAAESPLLDLLEREISERSAVASFGLDPGLSIEHWEAALLGPAREVLSRPGRRFRGRLVELAWEVAGGDGEPPPELAMAVEIIHAGSLVVDDVEDGSRWRRNRPALHRIYGVPLAINTGNWLYFWPHEIVRRMGLPAEQELRLRRLLSDAELKAHYGQALDLSLRASDLPQREMMPAARGIATLKTASLVELAATLGAVGAGAPEPAVEAVSAFGRQLGVALQHLDDLGGVLSPRMLEKGHEDLRQRRVTFVWGYAAERLSAAKFGELQHALGGLDEGPDGAVEALAGALRSVVAEGARPLVHEKLEEAFGALMECAGPSPAGDRLRREIERLEHGYA